MRKSMITSSVLSLLFLAEMSLAATQQQPQSDSMKHDAMSQGDTMANDKMSHKMEKAQVIKGWVTDSECAAHGDKMCGNKQHLAQGAKLVIVTDADKKIWTVANPEKVAEHQGHHVQLTATKDTEKATVTVEDVKMLKQGK
jgi:hypothetical protein